MPGEIYCYLYEVYGYTRQYRTIDFCSSMGGGEDKVGGTLIREKDKATGCNISHNSAMRSKNNHRGEAFRLPLCHPRMKNAFVFLFFFYFGSEEGNDS